MIADIWTIVWKDWKELLLQRGTMRQGWANVLIMLLIFGIFLPLQTGAEWVRSPFVLVSWSWVPLFLVVGVIADSFAGERERHTLETLLASRMPDRPILFGKMLAAVGYAWGITMVSLLLGLVAVNVANWPGHLLLYPASTGLGGAGLSLLMAWLAAGAGVLLSLRAPSVRQVQQTLSIATMVIVWIPILGMNAMPAEWRTAAVQGLQSVNGMLALAVVVAGLVVLDITLTAAAMARFQRARLILD